MAEGKNCFFFIWSKSINRFLNLIIFYVLLDNFSLQTTKKAIFLHILYDFRTQLYAISKLYFIKIISPLTMGLSKRWQFLPEHDFWLHEQFHDDYEWSNFLQRSMEFLILKIPWKKSINLFWIFKFFREIMFACLFTCEIFLTSQTYGIQIRSSVRSKIAVAFIHVKLKITGIIEYIIKIGVIFDPILFWLFLVHKHESQNYAYYFKAYF